MVRGALSDYHLIQLKVVTQKVPGPNPGTWCYTHLDSLDGASHIARSHCTRIIDECKNQQKIASLPRPSFL